MLVSKIERSIAESFINTNQSDGDLTVNKVTSLGVFESDILIAVAQFAYPRHSDLAKIYSVEIFNFTTIRNYGLENRSSLFNMLIDEYIEAYNPADLFSSEIYLNDTSEVNRLEKSTHVFNGKEIYNYFSKRTYYTYKITAANSEKYYYGVSHVKYSNATVDECANDGYLGSGGPKFKNWRNKYKDSINKDIIKTYDTRMKGFNAEAILIGDSWKLDPNCLNGHVGGFGDVPTKNDDVLVKNCKLHGLTKHRGEACYQCSNIDAVNMNYCSIHKETKFRGNNCIKCSIAATVKTAVCKNHGETFFYKDGVCKKCAMSKAQKINICEIHGRGKFNAEVCRKCSNAKIFSDKICAIHGKTSFRGKFCGKCMANATNYEKECSLHGMSIHRGDKCLKCINQKSIKLNICPTHGATKFSGSTCLKCSSSKVFTKKVCEKHGETTHRKNTCMTCANQALIAEKDCPVHGLTKFQGSKCMKCADRYAISVKNCLIHGEVKHRGDICYKCQAKKRYSKGDS